MEGSVDLLVLLLHLTAQRAVRNKPNTHVCCCSNSGSDSQEYLIFTGAQATEESTCVFLRFDS